MRKVAIIVPIYNEEKYISKFLRDLLKEAGRLPDVKKIILVDDGSTDKTKNLLQKFKGNSLIHVLTHKKNFGKGAALRSGLREAAKEKINAVVFMDADHQHRPYYLKHFIKYLESYPVVFGYRNLAKDTPRFRKVGNSVIRFIFRNFLGIKRKDLLCGFIAIREDLFDTVSWTSNDYGVETEISTIIGKKKVDFKEVLIKTIYIEKNKGVDIFDAIIIFLRIPFWYLRY